MIDRVLRGVPADLLQQAADKGNTPGIHAAADLMYASQQALVAAFGVLNEVGLVRDIDLPSEQERRELEAWRQGKLGDVEEARPLTIMEAIGQGFEDTAFILSIRLREAQSSENPDPEAATKTLSHIQALGRAWAAAEEKFHTPEAKSALELFDGEDNAYQIKNLPTNNVWVEAFGHAATAAKRTQENIPPVYSQEATPTRRGTEPSPIGFGAGGEIERIFHLGDPKKVRTELGKYLRQLRLAHNWTQRELIQGHYSVSYMSAVERGQIMPSGAALAWLLNRLGA